MRQAIRIFMLVEAASFITAALVHSGALIAGYEHRQARVAEAVIAVVLCVGLALTWIHPGWTRPVGLYAQAFALIGMLVGVFTIVIGVGPRTVPDIVYHVGILIVLICGLICGLNVAVRARSQEPGL